MNGNIEENRGGEGCVTSLFDQSKKKTKYTPVIMKLQLQIDESFY